MKNKLTAFIQSLAADQTACLAQAERLAADGRQDEANLAKIRANVFGIAAALAGAAGKRSPDDPVRFLREKLAEIPGAWAESLSAAETHGDDTKAIIERIKLDTAADINGRLAALEEAEA